MPARIYATSEGDFPAERSASRPAAASAAAEDSAPTLTALEALERERARTALVSSTSTHSVFVPPPSKPRTHLMEKAYVKNDVKELARVLFRPKPNLGLTGFRLLSLTGP